MAVPDERFERLLGPAAALVAGVFDALPDAIGMVWPVSDGAGAVVDFEVGYTNPSADRMMGLPMERERGTRLLDAMPGIVEMGLYDRLLRVARSGLAESEELAIDVLWRDTVHVRGAWIHTVLPFGTGVLSVAFDVTEERRRENDLRSFAAVAAHDLRDPLLGMDVMVQALLGRDALGAREHQMLEALGEGTRRARRLVDSILEYADSGPAAGPATAVDCGAVMDDVLAMLASRIERASGRVEVAVLPTVMASRPAVGRVFQNLIANALKFQGDAPPRVSVDAIRENGAWTFAVRDNGIGIGQDPAIFEMFARGDAATDRDGHGIGLATCRRIIEGHGGRIWAEQNGDGGSTFRFTLPALQA
jgi:signal transduction histidine kinase